MPFDARANTEPDLAHEPKPYVPALRRAYGPLAWLAWPIVRVTTGALLIPHGWSKLTGDMSQVEQSFADMGFAPGFAWFIALLELVGGALLALGLFTRVVAVLVIGFMATAVFAVHWPNGYMWTDGGFEYPLMWGLMALAVALRGGGPLSLDRAIGREV